jgi:hypothetical protein
VNSQPDAPLIVGAVYQRPPLRASSLLSDWHGALRSGNAHLPDRRISETLGHGLTGHHICRAGLSSQARLRQ